MEQVLLQQHVRLLRLTNSVLNPATRRCIEFSTLALAITTGVILFLVHLTYVTNSANEDVNCIMATLQSNLQLRELPRNSYASASGVGSDYMRFMRDHYDILRITITPSDMPPMSPMRASTTHTVANATNFEVAVGSSRSRSRTSEHQQMIISNAHKDEQSSSQGAIDDKGSSQGAIDDTGSTNSTDTCLKSSIDPDNLLESFENGRAIRMKRTYLFSLDRGKLMLSETSKKRLDFTELHIQLNGGSSLNSGLRSFLSAGGADTCFGPPMIAWLLHHVVGYDTVVMNWAIAAFEGVGFVYNAQTQQLFNLNSAGDFMSKKGVSLQEGRVSSSKALTEPLIEKEKIGWQASSTATGGSIWVLRVSSLLGPLGDAIQGSYDRGARLMEELESCASSDGGGDGMVRSQKMLCRMAEFVEGVLPVGAGGLLGQFLRVGSLTFSGLAIITAPWRSLGLRALSSVSSLCQRIGLSVGISCADSGEGSSTEGVGRVGAEEGHVGGVGAAGAAALLGSPSLESGLALLQQWLAFRAGVLLSTTFLFFVSSTLVSYTLRVTQERMLKFTYALNHSIRQRQPFMPLVLVHVTESLVFVPIMLGIHFFLANFFFDQLVSE